MSWNFWELKCSMTHNGKCLERERWLINEKYSKEFEKCGWTLNVEIFVLMPLLWNLKFHENYCSLKIQINCQLKVEKPENILDLNFALLIMILTLAYSPFWMLVYMFIKLFVQLMTRMFTVRLRITLIAEHYLLPNTTQWNFNRFYRKLGSVLLVR